MTAAFDKRLLTPFCFCLFGSIGRRFLSLACVDDLDALTYSIDNVFDSQTCKCLSDVLRLSKCPLRRKAQDES